MTNTPSPRAAGRQLKLIAHRLTIAAASFAAGALVIGHFAAIEASAADQSAHGYDDQNPSDVNLRSTMIIEGYPFEMRVVQTPKGLRFEHSVVDTRYRQHTLSVRLGDAPIDAAGRVAGLFGGSVFSPRGFNIPGAWADIADGNLNYKFVNRWAIDCKTAEAWVTETAVYLPGDTNPTKIETAKTSARRRIHYIDPGACDPDIDAFETKL